MAVGKVSFDDCDLFTSSLGCIKVFPVPKVPPLKTSARLAMTSFKFILLCVPEPVCQITSGN